MSFKIFQFTELKHIQIGDKNSLVESKVTKEQENLAIKSDVSVPTIPLSAATFYKTWTNLKEPRVRYAWLKVRTNVNCKRKCLYVSLTSLCIFRNFLSLDSSTSWAATLTPFCCQSSSWCLVISLFQIAFPPCPTYAK